MTELPPPINDASAWIGPDLEKRGDWIVLLSAEEVAEIEAAVRGEIDVGGYTALRA